MILSHENMKINFIHFAEKVRFLKCSILDYFETQFLSISNYCERYSYEKKNSKYKYYVFLKHDEIYGRILYVYDISNELEYKIVGDENIFSSFDLLNHNCNLIFKGVTYEQHR